MNRRGFLQLLASGLIGSAIDVDKLLWQPGAKTIFLPSLKETMYFNKIPIHTDAKALRDALYYWNVQCEFYLADPSKSAKIEGISE